MSGRPITLTEFERNLLRMLSTNGFPPLASDIRQTLAGIVDKYERAEPLVTDADDDQYKSQAARDAKRTNYGGKSYWAYLDEAAQRNHDYYMRHGQPDRAEEMLTRSLSESLMGNDGD